MSLFHRQAFVVLLTCFFATSALADDPVDEKNWLNEKLWPILVHDRSLKVLPTDDAMQALLKERYNAGQLELRNRYIYWLQRENTLLEVYDNVRRVIEARIEAGGPGSDKLTICKEKVAFARVVDKQAQLLRNKHNSTKQEIDSKCSKYFLAEAELELLRAEKAAFFKGK